MILIILQHIYYIIIAPRSCLHSRKQRKKVFVPLFSLQLIHPQRQKSEVQ